MKQHYYSQTNIVKAETTVFLKHIFNKKFVKLSKVLVVESLFLAIMAVF